MVCDVGADFRNKHRDQGDLLPWPEFFQTIECHRCDGQQDINVYHTQVGATKEGDGVGFMSHALKLFCVVCECFGTEMLL